MDYGRRPYIDNLSSYQESMKKYSDKAYENVLKSKMREIQPYSEFKKPYQSTDYQDMEYQEPPSIYNFPFPDPFEVPHIFEEIDPAEYEGGYYWTWDTEFTDAQWKIEPGSAPTAMWDGANWRWIVSDIDGSAETLRLNAIGTWYQLYSPTYARVTYTYNKTPFSRILSIDDGTHRIFYADPYYSYQIVPLEPGAEIYTISSLTGLACAEEVNSWLAITNIEFYVKIKK